MTAARWSDKRKAATARTRSDWRKLIGLAQSCLRGLDGGGQPDPHTMRDLRFMASGASVLVIEREIGAATADAAEAFLRVAKAFARRETPAVTRAGLVAPLKSLSAFLEGEMHKAAAADFQRAHAGRPEVFR